MGKNEAAYALTIYIECSYIKQDDSIERKTQEEAD